MTEAKDDRQMRLLEVLCEMWDSQRLLELFEAEYQRGRDDYRDDLFKHLDRPASDFVQKCLPPPKKGIETAEIKKTEVEVSALEMVVEELVEVVAGKTEPEKEVKPAREKISPREGCPPRPNNIPTTFSMMQTLLHETERLRADDLVALIEKRWWPGLTRNFLKPEISTLITKGRLDRDLDGFLSLTAKGKAVNSVDLREIGKGKQPPQVPLAPIAPRINSIKFKSEQGEVDLPVKEYQLVSRLYACKGSHVAASFLAEKILGTGHRRDAESTLRDLASICNPKIASLGIGVSFYNGFGFIMKDLGT